jgi:hypothetical protein
MIWTFACPSHAPGWPAFSSSIEGATFLFSPANFALNQLSYPLSNVLHFCQWYQSWTFQVLNCLQHVSLHIKLQFEKLGPSPVPLHPNAWLTCI